jgi:hypothetical protein
VGRLKRLRSARASALPAGKPHAREGRLEPVSERTKNRGVAVGVAALVALCVVGLSSFLSGSPEEPGSRTGAQAPAAVTPSRAQRTPRPAQVAGSGQKAREASPQGADGVLEVEVLSVDGPLPGAQLQLYAREPADLLSFPAQWHGLSGGETGAEGRRVFPVPPGSYSVTARAQGLAPGYAAVVHPPGGLHTHVRVLLEKGGELVGTTVVKGTGDLVSLAEIILTPYGFGPDPWRPGSLDAPEEEAILATSNETGEFRLSGLAPGKYRVEARAPGYVSTVLPEVPVPFGGRITLELIPGGRLEGLVLRADGQPAAGAEVLAASSKYGPTALADKEGLFALEVPQGTYAVSARSGEEVGALDREVTVAVGQRVQGLRLQLGAGARISGKVIRKDSSPVIAARVEVRPQASPAISGLMGTDESGSFSSPPLAAGVYTVRVFMPGGASFDHGPLRLASGEHASVTLTYEPRGEVECQVLDALNHGVRGLRVRASARSLPATVGSTAVETSTDAWGFARFPELEPGLFRVEVLPTASSLGSEQSLVVDEHAVTKCFFRVPTQEGSEGAVSTVEGRVMQRSGAPPPAVMQVVAISEAPPRRSMGRSLTDEQGRFKLALPPGSYSLTARPMWMEYCRVSGESPLQVEAGRSSEATILLAEPPAPALHVQVLEAEGTPAVRALVKVYVSSSYIGWAQTDERGRLDVCLPPAPQQAPRVSLIVSSLDGERAGLLETADGQRELTLRLRPLPSVRGRVINPSGTPVRRVVVEAHLFAREGPFEFMGDEFELRGLNIGLNQLIVTADGQLRASVHLDLRPEEHKVLEISLYPGVLLKGRLIDADSRQPRGGEVFVSPFQFTSSDPETGFVFRDLPPGDHFLMISGGPSGPHEQVPLKLVPGQVTDLGDIPVHSR